MSLDYETDMEEDAPEVEAEQPQVSAIEALQAIMAAPNLVPEMEEQPLGEIAAKVCDEYKIDLNSRKSWEDRIAEAMSLAMLVSEDKSYPFEKASNIKYPLLTEAALQFNARAYPAIVQSDGVVKGKVYGDDPQGKKAQRADRVSQYLSFKLLADMPEWEEDTDRLLVMLPIIGCVFRKQWYDPATGRCRSRLLSPTKFVVNYWAQSLESVPRHTEEIDLYPYEIEERIRAGRFIEFDYDGMHGESDSDKSEGDDNANDPNEPHLFLEQHRLLDLDGDGYPEPYVVTVHKATQTVVRIVANFNQETVRLSPDGQRVISIRKNEYYTKYDFMPNPEGGFYGMGFGWLLHDISETINSTLNQMLDAGHLSNIQGGLISAQANIRERSIKLKPGEWKVIQSNGPISQSVQPIKYDGPSATLFQLLGLMIESGKDVSAVKDVLTGEGQGKNASPTTTLALIEQGLQQFTSVYKRVYRGLKNEFGILSRLVQENVSAEEYAAFFDMADAQGNPLPIDPRADFNDKDMDVLPVADPNAVSKMQKLAKAQFIYETAQGNPLVNPIEALKRLYEAAAVEDIDQLIVPPQPPDPEQQAMLKAMAWLELEERAAGVDKTRAETLESETGAMKDIADAAENANLNRAKMVLDAIKTELKAEQDAANGQGRVPGMAGQPGNPMGAGQAAPQGGGNAGQPSGPASVVNTGGPGGLGGAPSQSGL